MGVEVYTPEEVAIMMNCSITKAYNMIRALNLKKIKDENLTKETVRYGRISKDYFNKIHEIKKVD